MPLVGLHQTRTFSSPVLSGAGVNANDVRGNDNVLKTALNAHDADATIHVQTSPLASRPAAGVVGRLWATTDTGSVTWWYDTGAAWVAFGYLAATATGLSSPATLPNGAGTATGTLTNAPVAGNPTKWITLNDNGTTRYIPAW
jgi:hypothetical protein